MERKKIFQKLYSVGLLIIFLCSFFNIKAQDSINIKLPNSNKNPIKAKLFRQYLDIRNESIKWKYHLNSSFSQNKHTLPKFVNTNMVLTFEDNFDSLDLNKWRKGQPWGQFHPDHPYQYFSDECIKIDSGKLKLLGKYQPKTFISGDSQIKINYAIGLINSDISFNQKYGYFEICSKNPEGAATFPAFWLTGVHRWPPEIDIFEMYGKKGKGSINYQTSTIHFGKTNTKSKSMLTKKTRLAANTTKDFHTYACLWTPKYIKMYFDGKLVKYIKLNKKLKLWLDDEMVLILNNAFEEKYLKYLKSDFKQNEFVIDWIRVYQFKSNVKL